MRPCRPLTKMTPSSDNPSPRPVRLVLLALAGAGAVTAAVAFAASGGTSGRGRPQFACALQQSTTAAGARQEPDDDKTTPQQRDEGTSSGPNANPRPYPNPNAGRPRGPLSPLDLGWGAYGRGHPDLRSPRPQEWEEVRAFMNRYSPRRQAALEGLPDDDRKESIRKFVFARYRSLQALQKRDKAAFDGRVAQLSIEDEIYGLVSQWGTSAEADRNQLRDALKSEVSKLVDVDLQERRRRVEWLKKELADQSQALERDEKDRDTLVEKRVSRYADWGDRLAARRAAQEKKAKRAAGQE
jgi:hypothetical protein